MKTHLTRFPPLTWGETSLCKRILSSGSDATAVTGSIVSVPRTTGAGSHVVLPNEVQGLSSRVGDFTEIGGLRPVEVIERIPKDWVVDVTAKDGGLIYRPADAALAKYNHVRIMVDSNTGLPYARVLKNGSYMNNAGQKITGTTTANKAASGHIPLSW